MSFKAGANVAALARSGGRAYALSVPSLFRGTPHVVSWLYLPRPLLNVSRHLLVCSFLFQTIFLDIRTAFDRASASLQVFESTANAVAQASLHYRSELYEALRVAYNAIRSEGADALKGIVFQDPDILAELKTVLDTFDNPEPSVAVAKPPGASLFFFPWC